jgi:hypothetical protein
MLSRITAVFVGFLLFSLPAARAADGQAADDIAHFLAGMEPSANSPLAELAKSPAWKQYAASFDAEWKSLDANQISKVRAWSAENITQSEPVLYYMFSGPDYLYANAFFPNVKTYIMAGLELTGSIPDVKDITPYSLAGELYSIRASLGDLFHYGYFITRDMGSQLSRARLSGTIPVIYVFLARAGKTIHDVSLIALDKDGKVHPADEAGLGNNATRGVKIVFAGADGNEQTLYYFRTDLSDGGVKTSGFLQFCGTFGTGDALIKSASYLLHNNGFSAARDFLLNNTSAIAQDDTGIPLKYLNATEWQLHPFGQYVYPIRIFSGNYQPNLVELFRKNKATPISFSLGYHSNRAPNLLLALKSSTASAAKSTQ